MDMWLIKDIKELCNFFYEKNILTVPFIQVAVRQKQLKYDMFNEVDLSAKN